MLNVSRKTWLILVTVFASLFVVGVAWAASGSFTDTSIANFNGGTVGSCFVAESGWDGTDGELILAPTVFQTFPGNSVPTGWNNGVYGGGSVPIVANSIITADQGFASDQNAYSPTLSLEFEATFTAGSSQFVGLARDNNLTTTPWILFATDGTPHLSSEYNFNVAQDLGSTYFGTPHRYRIDWSDSDMTFYVDGSSAGNLAQAEIGPMRFIVADSNGDGNPVSVAWMRMSPYSPTPCTYTSRIFNKGDATSWWNNLISTPDLPAGTSAPFKVRFATTLTPAPDWTSWLTPAGGSGINRQEQYLQYQVTLTTSDAQFTPAVPAVTVTFSDTPTAVTLQSLTGRSVGAEMGLVLPAALILAAAGYVVLRKRRRISN